MAKKDLVIFSLDVLLMPDGTFTPGADGIIGSQEFLKAFIASEKDSGFSWSRIAKLNSSGSFSGHCMPNSQSADDCKYVLQNLLGWICRQHDVGKKFFIVRNEMHLEQGKTLGLVGIKVEGPIIPVEQLFLV